MEAKEEARIKEIRRKIIGQGLIAYLKDHPDQPIHIVYRPNEEDK